MAYLLAADIGGTKTLMQLSNTDNQVLVKQRYESSQYADFSLIVGDFLAQVEVEEVVACFAVAGPVSGNTATVTNLPWKVSVDELLTQHPVLKKVVLCNDFAAIGYGIASLTEQDVLTLQEGQNHQGPRAVIGAGTGLGQAYMIEQAHGWDVFGTEGGHTDFSPTDDLQSRLYQQLQQRFGHVSYERLVSGNGLVVIYAFLRAEGHIVESTACQKAIQHGDAAQAISEFAHQGDALALAAFQLFFQIYGAQAGNLALMVMPKAGLYIAGGIVTKNIELLKKSGFVSALLDKGRMKPLLETIPVKVILQAEVGLMGARSQALKALYN